MPQMTDKLNEILKNPDAMSKIMEIASSFGGERSEKTEELPIMRTEKDDRLELLNALRPLLRERKRARLDSLTKAMTMANLLGKMKGGR